MAENLNYETKLSSSYKPNENSPISLKGRYYHVSERDSICPCEWKLPDAEDWINYFKFLSENDTTPSQVQLSMHKKHIALSGYEGNIELFGSSNPLDLVPNGRMEGGTQLMISGMADYWTADPPNFGEGDRNTRTGVVHVIKQVEDGTTHIHMRASGLTNIHSHRHHLDPKKEKKLRLFMVRCIKKN
jgi:uncharacterized protein (TIGR02145 family)